MIASEALPDLTDIALPTINIYKGGNLLYSFVRIQNSLPKSFDIDHLETFLKQ